MDPTLTFKFGIDTVLSCKKSLELLKRSRFALVAHPASVTTSLVHTLDALATVGALPHCVFGPQHGARGDKQDNMIETEDFVDPLYDIPCTALRSKPASNRGHAERCRPYNLRSAGRWLPGVYLFNDTPLHTRSFRRISNTHLGTRPTKPCRQAN